MLGFQIDSRSKKLNDNYENFYEKLHGISMKWARYQLFFKGRITIAKTFLLPQFTYMVSLLDPNVKMYETINRFIRNFVNRGQPDQAPGKIGFTKISTDPKLKEA